MLLSSSPIWLSLDSEGWLFEFLSMNLIEPFEFNNSEYLDDYVA